MEDKWGKLTGSWTPALLRRCCNLHRLLQKSQLLLRQECHYQASLNIIRVFNCVLEPAKGIGGFGPCAINGTTQKGYDTSHPMRPLREFLFYTMLTTTTNCTSRSCDWIGGSASNNLSPPSFYTLEYHKEHPTPRQAFYFIIDDAIMAKNKFMWLEVPCPPPISLLVGADIATAWPHDDDILAA